jgi:hypothetical protein
MINVSLFPNLSAYEQKSDPSDLYNCIAFAAGIEDEWVDPLGVWPDDIGKDDTVENLIEVYRRYGFEPCDDSQMELGFDKLAIYATDGGVVYQHAARLHSDGQWWSKIGPDDDILHPTLEALECEQYGQVVKFMRRPTRYVAGETTDGTAA